MSLQERLTFWSDPDQYDETPSAEDALRQFVYVAIGDFVEEHAQELVDWLTDDDAIDEVPHLSEWVDEYAERSLSERDGWARTEPIVAS